MTQNTSIKQKGSKAVRDDIWLNSAWRGHVELMSHLCQVAHNTLLVIGPKQVGKSAFCRYFLRQTIPKCQIVGFSARAWENVEALMEAIAKVLSLSVAEGLTAFQSVKNYLETLSSTHPTIVLLIDDAHLLADELLQSLYVLLKCENDSRPVLHLILFGEPSLELRLFSPKLSAMINGRIYTIELEGWSLSEVRQFLFKDSRLATLTPDQINDIFEKTQGLPGLVESARADYLKQIDKEDTRMTGGFQKWRKSPVILGVLIGLVGGSSYILMNRSEKDEIQGQSPIELAQIEHPTLPQEQIAVEESQLPAMIGENIDRSDIIEADAHEHPEPEDSELGARDPLKSDESTAATQENGMADALPVTIIEPTAMDMDRLESAEEETSQASETTDTSAIKPPESQTQTQAEPVQPSPESVSAPSRPEKRHSLSEKEKYLLSLDKQGYTLQLVGARNEENIKYFMSKHGIEQKATYFKTKLSGKDWYVVVYGHYPTLHEAKAAIAQLPATLADAPLEPWIREISAVQADIQKIDRG